MKILLDTHFLIWIISDPAKLSASEKKFIVESNSEFYVSLISFWEISLKSSLSKLKLQNLTISQILEAAKNSGFEIVPMTETDVVSFHRLPIKNHKDPFDRMLVTQAINNDFLFLTRDKDIKDYEDAGLKILNPHDGHASHFVGDIRFAFAHRTLRFSAEDGLRCSPRPFGRGRSKSESLRDIGPPARV